MEEQAWRFWEWQSKPPYFASSMAYIARPRWSLGGMVCETLPLQLPSPNPWLSVRENPQRHDMRSHKDSNNEGDRDNSPKRDQAQWDKSNRTNDETPKKYSCFLYNGPHWVIECSKCGKLDAFIMERERKEKKRKIASLSLLSAIQTKLGSNLMAACM